jgi:glycosyltransferase involved in cell wall biosynthesis
VAGNRKWRLAVVVQRYGEEINGGAEQHARWLAEHLTMAGTESETSLAQVDVITTCAVDYQTWANVYPAGKSELNGVCVHRFPVDESRNWARARKLTATVLNWQHTLFDELTWIKVQGPYSTPLLNFLRRNYGIYDLFIFYTFHYATTFFGLPLVSDKALLIPTAHDDPFLHMPAFRPLFHLPRAIVYNTEPERALVQRITQNHHVPDIVNAVGISRPVDVSGERFRTKFNMVGDFVLYVGRIHESKNVPELLAHFERYREAAAATMDKPLKLVLIGKSHIRLPSHPDIVHLGFVSDQDKYDALAAATLLVLPSLFESLSMITLEAWLMGVPVLVNGRCEVLKYQCRQSNGGLYYTSYEEFALALQQLHHSPELRAQLGRQGQVFVRQHYLPDKVLERYHNLLEMMIE